MADNRVLVVGGGGREHALCLGLNKSPDVAQIFCCPGNAGTQIVAENVKISTTDVESIVEFCLTNAVDLVVVGPEAPLCLSLADRLIDKNIPCFGPVAALAELEGSKLHAKQVMNSVGVPTASYKILDDHTDIELALDGYQDNPWVIKRDVLAGGKGVVVTNDRFEAMTFINESIFMDGRVILEEFLPGEEASMLVVMDGSGYVCLPPSQDHKRAYDGDNGPNTGGMGAYCPAPIVDQSVFDKTKQRIIEPMFQYLSNLPVPYRGVLYVGLMINDSGDPYVVEFNVRFGDPECQVTLPLIKTDLFALLNKSANDELSTLSPEFYDAHAITIVLASEGYPANPVKNRVIHGIGQQNTSTEMNSAWVNHAGTKFEQNQLISSGGRVLSCSSMAASLVEAVELAYQLIGSITLEGSHYRSDIGGKALDQSGS